MTTTIVCAWCGKTLKLTSGGRPKQHFNGSSTCVGSGQKAEVHANLHAAHPAPPAAKPKRK